MWVSYHMHMAYTLVHSILNVIMLMVVVATVKGVIVPFLSSCGTHKSEIILSASVIYEMMR